MFHVMLQKIWHKKWMSACLLGGIILLIATAVSFPIYQKAAFDRMLQEEFDQYYARNGVWPALDHLSYTARKEGEAATIERMENFVRGMHEQMGVTGKEIVSYYVTSRADARSEWNRDDVQELSLRISFLSQMEEHIRLISGELYSESGISEDGCIEALVSPACMVNSLLLLGETLEFPALKNPQGESLRVRIVGIFEAEDEKDTYWQVPPDSLTNNCMIREELFREYFSGKDAEAVKLTASFYPIWEYKDLKTESVDHLYETASYMAREGAYSATFSEPVYLEILDSFRQKRTRINAALFLLQIPLWILLGAFLFMISAQMYDVERNEISVTKSRGGSGVQIFLLYLYQSIFLTALGAAVGLPLGKAFAGLLGATGNFLEFRMDRSLDVSYTREAFLYLLAAAVGCILMMTLPAVGHSRLSIVNLKQKRASVRWSWWEIIFLDVILLAVSLYGYYSCVQGAEEIAEDAVRGAAMDPLLYISSSLFIIGAGLLFVRFQPWIVRLVYWVGQRFWRPASYISFMENRKNGRKQQAIILFLILAISLGMYHSTAARTILQNARENKAYIDGTDIVVREVWRNNGSLKYEGIAAKLEYYEPGFEKYSSLPGAASVTKVIRDSGGHTRSDGNMVTLMGIHTRQFAQNTSLPEGLMEKSFYEYLNELAQAPAGALVSSNFRDLLGCSVGDRVTLYNGDSMKIDCEIVDFVDYWPGFSPMEMVLNPDGSVTHEPRFLAVMNIMALNEAWGNVPYEVWIRMEEGASGDIGQWLADNDVRLEEYRNREDDLEAVETDPLLQGTNGILTMGFLVTMILCATGYLIYWILSIRSRKMMFGILRAEGLHRGEIFHLLINEQIFCGGFSVLAGTVVGILSSRMFVPVLQEAYAGADQVLPLHLITQKLDMLRLYSVVGATLAVCLVILLVLVQKLNVAKALKLGEE